MNYINRTRIGLELFMDHLSPITSRINTHSPEDTAQLLMQEPFSHQTAECRRIHDGLKKLMSDAPHLSEILTQRVTAVAKSPYTPPPDRLVPVFRWVQALRESNKLAYDRWLTALKDCCSGLTPETGEFLRSFAEISAQRVSLIPEGDTLTLSTPDALWGQMTLRFTGIPAEQLPSGAQFGYLFWVEGDRLPDGRQFRFMLDTSFSNTDYQQRLLADDDWTELTFTCTGIESSLRLHNYTARAEYHGFSGYNAMILCFGELLRKYFTLGQNALNGPEFRLVPIATLFYRLDLVPTAPILNDHLPPTTLLVDNRYQLMQMVSFLNRMCGKSGETLATLLESASDDFTAEDSYACQKKLNLIQKAIHLMLENGEIRQIAQPVLIMLREASAAYTDPPPFRDFLEDMEQRLSAELVPILHTCGFSGAFPNYHRVRNGFAEYISFLTDFMPAASSSGALLLSGSIAVARCPAEEKNGVFTVFDCPYEAFGASEFMEDRFPGCRFGRVCSAVQDDIRCVFPYHLDPRDEDIPHRDAAIQAMITGLHIALLSLDGHPLPKNYHPHSKGFLRHHHVFSDLFNRTLFWGLPVAAIVIFLLRSHLYGLGNTLLITLSGLTAGLVTVTVITLLRYILFRRRIWHR